MLLVHNMVRRRALSSKEISVCTMLVLERNQSWGPLLILFFFSSEVFAAFFSSTGYTTHYTNKSLFFQKFFFLVNLLCTFISYIIFSPSCVVIHTIMYLSFRRFKMSRQNVFVMSGPYQKKNVTRKKDLFKNSTHNVKKIMIIKPADFYYYFINIILL